MKTKLLGFLFLAGSIIPNLLFGQFMQQGPKLVGTGGVGSPVEQGQSVAISSDGNTAIEGGWVDSSGTGAVWVFTRSGGVWTQQGPKLVGTGAVGEGNQGYSVAISSDGNTAIEGGISDVSGIGAVWIFTRSGGVWTQQGSKLVGTGAVGNSSQGLSVAISSDGNTAIEGGPADNSDAGAVWVFTRSGGVWTQQGPKLIGTGAVGDAVQGCSVAISSDGNTAIEGGVWDNNNSGAVWVFTRSGGVWTQQGPKLVGSGAVGTGGQGFSVAISSDGNTAIEGGAWDNNDGGAVWVFTRSGGVWTQQGPKLVGTGVVGTYNIYQGRSVAISPDGNTAIEGGYGDNSFAGAIWVFTRSGGVWTQQGPKLVGTGAVGSAQQGTSLAISSEGTAIEGGTYDNNTEGAVWVFYNPTVSVSTKSQEVPKRFRLMQNYPNPFNPTTNIKFDVTSNVKGETSNLPDGKAGVKLIIYDALGREVEILVNQQLEPGTYQVDWNASSAAGGFSSGMYFYRLASGNFVETKKMVLLK
jgi:methionine-rich copper-binding protein CopC